MTLLRMDHSTTELTSNSKSDHDDIPLGNKKLGPALIMDEKRCLRLDEIDQADSDTQRKWSDKGLLRK